jgi:hypothetical protein
MNLETGDIILTSKNNIVVKFMRLFQTDPVFWGHVLLVKDSETAWEVRWYIRESKLKDVFAKHPHYKIIRKKNITDRQKELIKQIAPKVMGTPYGIGRIGLQFFDKVWRTTWFTDIDNGIYNQVCSSFVAWVYEMSCRYKFNGISWQSCDPDDIEDDQEAHPETWKVLGTRGIQRKDRRYFRKH